MKAEARRKKKEGLCKTTWTTVTTGLSSLSRLSSFAAMAAVAMCACEAWAWNGKVKITANTSDVGMGGTQHTCVWQTDFEAVGPTSSDTIWGRSNYSVAYLLDGGLLKFRDNCYVQAPYTQVRQTGGVFSLTSSGFRVVDRYHNENSFRGDFIYSGNAVATNAFADFTFPHCISVSDNADIQANWINIATEKWTNSNIVAINGGLLAANSYDRGSSCAYFYNGGELFSSYGGHSAVFGTKTIGDEVVRVCERGGCLRIAARTTELASFREPIDKVVKTVELTAAVRDMVWPIPPAVVITGSGSNAFAVADWDFDTGHVTNITVLCCGEGYTDDGTTKANFAYKKGDALLEAPLDCTLGTVRADGDFTFAMEAGGGDTAYFQAVTCTNEWRGATIIDTDRKRTITHDAALTTSDYGHSLATYSSSYFPYTTNIIIKSGELIDASDSSINPKFPSCNRLEAYSGHLARGTHRFKDVVIGGELWLCCINKSHGYTSVLNVTNTLWVAPGASVTNGVVVTPKVKYGTFTINNDAKVAIQDWSKLPKGKKIVALDLSEVSTLNRKSGGPTLMPSDEGVLEWDDTEKKLYARRHTDGFFMIFK